MDFITGMSMVQKIYGILLILPFIGFFLREGDSDTKGYMMFIGLLGFGFISIICSLMYNHKRMQNMVVIGYILMGIIYMTIIGPYYTKHKFGFVFAKPDIDSIWNIYDMIIESRWNIFKLGWNIFDMISIIHLWPLFLYRDITNNDIYYEYIENK